MPARRFTVLVLHNRYRQRGGEDAVFEAECAMLDEAGHRVVRLVADNGDLDERRGRLGLFLRTLWSRSSYRRVREAIRREKPDVVHVHNFFPLLSPSVHWAAAAEGVPVVQTLHNYRLCCLDGYLFRDGAVCERCLGRLPWRGLRRRCYRESLAASFALFAMLALHRALGTWRRKVDRYVALTEFAKAKFVAAGLPAEKIDVKPNAVAAAGGRDRVVSSRKSHGASPSTCNLRPVTCDLRPATCDLRPATCAPRVLFLGRLSPEKGADLLLDAWRLLSAESTADPPSSDSGLPQRELWIAGDGPERAALEKRAAGLRGVRFLGTLPHEEAMGRLAEADLLVVPSRWYEQFAIVPLEAAVRGVPVAVSRVAHGATCVRDGVDGRVFETGSASSLADVLRALLADPARLRAMGEAARAAFLAGPCRPDRNLAALLDIYEMVRRR